MFEAKNSRVKSVSSELRRDVREVSAHRPQRIPVERIGQERRATHFTQMHADLVGSARLESTGHERGSTPREDLDNGEMSDRSAPFLHPGRELQPILRIAAVKSLDAPGLRHAESESIVNPFDAMSRELKLEAFPSALGASHNQNPRRIAIDAMDDPGAEVGDRISIVTARCLEPSVGQKPIHESPRGVAASRMDNNPRRFLDHEQRVILEEHAKWHSRIRSCSRKWDLARIDEYPNSPEDSVLRSTCPAIDQNATLRDPSLNGRAGDLRHQAREDLVDALCRAPGGRLEFLARARLSHAGSSLFPLPNLALDVALRADQDIDERPVVERLAI